MSYFFEKLQTLPKTAALLADLDAVDLRASLDAGRERRTLAVGSGGSLIAASYFARCRETVFGEPTCVGTPAHVVLGTVDLSNADVWLFSANAANPDIEASIDAATTRRARSVNLVTTNPMGSASLRIQSQPRGRVHRVPVSDRKDGFLATHSLVGTVGALLHTFDSLSDDPVGRDLPRQFVAAITDAVTPDACSRIRRELGSVSSDDVLVILSDPQLEPVSMLIETSAWETALCAVQRTDPRNFAHGRHTWIKHQGSRTILLGLLGNETRDIWTSISKLLPPGQRQASMRFGDCGRFRNAVGIVDGMVLIEAIGRSQGVDPARPVIGPFGRPIYHNTALRNLSTSLVPAARQKRAAILRRDDPANTGFAVQSTWRKRLARLTAAKFRGLVLDYDGTMVPTENRCEPPSRAMIRELARLHNAGLAIGIATGRGGSAGEELRAALPGSMHSRIVMGYYNGGYLTALDIDIDKHPPPPDEAIEEVFQWLQRNRHFFRKYRPRNSRVQISLSVDDVESPERLLDEIQHCPALTRGAVKVNRSGHGIDLFRADISKRVVIEALAQDMEGDNSAILCIGDSGSRGGNDNELLSHEFGISVGSVCGTPGGSWSLFGDEVTGPAAVIRILRAMQPDAPGTVRINLHSLETDFGLH